MANFHIDEPREIGKKKLRISTRDKRELKDDEDAQKVIDQLGIMEAETLWEGLRDGDDKSKVMRVYTLMTGNSHSQDPNGPRITGVASRYYKEAGYNIISEGECGEETGSWVKGTRVPGSRHGHGWGS